MASSSAGGNGGKRVNSGLKRIFENIGTKKDILRVQNMLITIYKYIVKIY